jgi:uracil phosphoribosyltransferase
LTLLAWSIYAVSRVHQLESPLDSYQGEALKENIAIVPVLRSGLGLVEGMSLSK